MLYGVVCAKDGLTGSAWGDWANYTASPLRAFENELGVQDPVGFWDPAGFTADGSVEDFKRRRQTEIKHGRIAMLAAMGYITPEQLGCRLSTGAECSLICSQVKCSVSYVFRCVVDQGSLASSLVIFPHQQA